MIEIYFFLMGLIFGSFISAASWRLRLDSNESLLKGRSKCPNCGHSLRAVDLIPVFSWVVQRGKCRYCQQSISARYPLTELSAALLFTASYVLWDKTENYWQLTLLVWLTILVWLLILAIIDLETKKLPYKITFPLLGFQLVAIVVLWVFDIQSGLSNLAAAGIFGGFFAGLWYLSDGKWIGDGDIPLLMIMGLQLGVFGTFVALFIGSSIGSIYALSMIAINKRDRTQTLAFGPLLILGTITYQLLENQIANLLLL